MKIKFAIIFALLNLYSTLFGQIPNQTHNTGTMQLTVFDNGVIGFDSINNIGNGVIFNGGPQALWTAGVMIGTEINGATGMMASIGAGAYWDNVNLVPMMPFTADGTYNEISESGFTDTNAPLPFGVEILQRTFSNSSDDFVFLEYTILNTSNSDINDFYVGIFADWDIGDYSINRGGYDLTRNLAYQYEFGSAIDPNYYGIVVLNNYGGAWISTYGPSRNEVFTLMTSFLNDEITTSLDYRTYISSGPFNLLANDQIVATFAVVCGESLEDIKANADVALTRLDIEENNTNKPDSFRLNQNFPNPFNPTTKISYSLDKDSDISINIYDISGMLISTLQNEYQPQGEHSYIWDGTDDIGNRVGGGVYLYQVKAGESIQTKKMVLLK